MVKVIRPLELGRVYRVTFSYGYGPKSKRKRRTLGRLVGRLIEVNPDQDKGGPYCWIVFQENKRTRSTLLTEALVELKYIEDG